MSLYTDYLNEIETRKDQGLNPKPIDDGALLKEIIAQIKDVSHEFRKDSLHFLFTIHSQEQRVQREKKRSF